MDLGTANTIIYYQDKVVVDEPSIVAKDRRTGNVVAIGRLAQQMHGKTHKNSLTRKESRQLGKRCRCGYCFGMFVKCRHLSTKRGVGLQTKGGVTASVE